MLQIAFHPNYVYPVPEGHRFPMLKYQRLPELLMDEGIVKMDAFFEPNILEEGTFAEAHDISYIEKLKNGRLTDKEMRVIGFHYSPELIDREMTIASGTVVGALHALENKVAMNIAGGTHHAYSDRGEGFCILNDQAVAAKYLLNHGFVNRVAIIDLDVHQGNGTAEICAGDDRIFTFSMHGEKNYPFRKEQSDWDIGLEIGTTDGTYLNILKDALTKIFNEFKPDFVFYQSGVDVLETDKLGHLSLTINGCKRRDELVISKCEELKIPMQISMGGGYSPDLDKILEAHLNTYRVAQEYLG